MDKVSIKITIKSSQQSAVEAASLKVAELATLQKFINVATFGNETGENGKSSRTGLPPSISRFTVLRSPHIDKKSREQFQHRTVAIAVLLPPMVISTVPLLLAALKNSQVVGVHLRVTVAFSTGFYK